MKINESLENYLETILILTKTLPEVRSIDIATELNFKKSSVSVAMKNLSGEGYISLTNEGNYLAEKVYEKHTLLSKI